MTGDQTLELTTPHIFRQSDIQVLTKHKPVRLLRSLPYMAKLQLFNRTVKTVLTHWYSFSVFFMQAEKNYVDIYG